MIDQARHLLAAGCDCDYLLRSPLLPAVALILLYRRHQKRKRWPLVFMFRLHALIILCKIYYIFVVQAHKSNNFDNENFHIYSTLFSTTLHRSFSQMSTNSCFVNVTKLMMIIANTCTVRSLSVLVCKFSCISCKVGAVRTIDPQKLFCQNFFLEN